MENIKITIDNIISFVTKNRFIFISLVIYVLFYTFFENIITIGIVDPFLSKLESTVLNDVIFYIFLFLIIGRCGFNIYKNYTVTSRYILLSILCVFLIVFYRVTEIPWQFTSLYSFKFIKYVDCILLFFVSNIIIAIAHKGKDYSEQVDKRKGFYFDNPIKTKGEDVFKRNLIAKQIAERIQNTANNNTAFAIGVNAEWGQGKTSFLNLINENLKIDSNHVIIEFNPWLNNDEKAIVNSFFDELSSKLKYNKELSDDILKYSELLNTVNSNSIVSILSKALLNKDNSLKNKFENINTAIKRSGFQIVVFIDDLDRLYETEILEVLKLIRNSANFANTVFVVAYDRNYLVSAIEKENTYHPDFYLEKIFQIEISLPTYERNILEKKLKEQILPHLDEDDKKEFEEVLNNINIYSSLFFGNYFNINHLSNLRDVNRLSNSFLISYESLKGEVLLVDLLNVEMLRIKYLSVYNLLANKHNKFLASYTYQSSKSFLSLKKIKDKNGNDTNEIELKKYLEAKYSEVGIQKNQIDDVIEMVYDVFPHYNYFPNLDDNLLSIANPICIYRYFHYSLLNSNLSEIEFSNSRKENSLKFNAKIKEWIKKDLEYEVKLRLENITLYANKDDYEKIILAIFYLTSLDKGQYNYIDFNNRNLYEKLRYESVSKFYNSKEDFKSFVLKIFKEYPKPYMFISKLIESILEFNRYEWNFVLSKEELLELKLDYFNEYSSTISEIDKCFFWLYSDTKYKESIAVGSNKYKIEEIEQTSAKIMFMSCARRLPESFIKNIISKPRQSLENKLTLFGILNNIILDVWNSWNEFEEFIESLNDLNLKGLNEFKAFYQLCKENNYGYSEFEFKEIDMKNALLFTY